jgi:hypothetical protein
MAVLRELGRLAGSPDSAPAAEQLGAALAHTREAGSREQVGYLPLLPMQCHLPLVFYIYGWQISNCASCPAFFMVTLPRASCTSKIARRVAASFFSSVNGRAA